MMIYKTIFILLIISIILSCTNASDEIDVNIIPNHMVDNRYILELPTKNNDTLNFFTDTGGGFDILWKSSYERFKFPYKKTEVRGRNMQAVVWDSIELKSTYESKELFKEELIVFPAPKMMPPSDGFLGGSFFVKGSIWQFDYPNKTIGTIDSINWSKRSTNQIPMKMEKNANEKVTGIHSALDIMIKNDTLEVLFDTGATFLPTKKGREYIEPKGLESYAGSYLSSKKIKELHRQYPKWPFVEDGSRFGGGAAIIKVPQVKIGDQYAENVWFIERPGTNFVKINGEHLEGAIGGNVMKNFRVIADYRQQVFEFEKKQ